MTAWNRCSTIWVVVAETGTQAIDRAADLLVSVVESTRPLGIGELSESAGLPKSTTSRLVGALERRGLVQRAGDRRVAPGPVLLRFAHRDLGASLVEIAAPALKALSQLSGETINLGVPTRNTRIFNPQIVLISATNCKGRLRDLHTTGHMILIDKIEICYLVLLARHEFDPCMSLD